MNFFRPKKSENQLPLGLGGNKIFTKIETQSDFPTNLSVLTFTFVYLYLITLLLFSHINNNFFCFKFFHFENLIWFKLMLISLVTLYYFEEF